MNILYITSMLERLQTIRGKEYALLIYVDNSVTLVELPERKTVMICGDLEDLRDWLELELAPPQKG